MEEKVSKMKGLLVKTKKELAESKKNVSVSYIIYDDIILHYHRRRNKQKPYNT